MSPSTLNITSVKLSSPFSFCSSMSAVAGSREPARSKSRNMLAAVRVPKLGSFCSRMASCACASWLRHSLSRERGRPDIGPRECGEGAGAEQMNNLVCTAAPAFQVELP